MRGLLRTGVKYLLIFGIIIIIVHELGAYVMTYWHLSDVAGQVVESSAVEYRSAKSQSQAYSVAQHKASQEGVELTTWDLIGQALTVKVTGYADNTWFLYRIEYFKPYMKITVMANGSVSEF